MAAKYQDYYRILGIERGADETEVKRAFRRLAREYHPDANKGNKLLEAKFKDLNEAYEVLSDPEKRARYDSLQHDTFRNFTNVRESMRANAEGAAAAARAQAAHEEKAADATGSGFSEFFDSLFGSKRAAFNRQKKTQQRGDDRQVPVEIQLGEAFTGTRKTISAEREETCVACGGFGQQANAPCKVCRGQGTVSHRRQLEVKIPAGVRTGSRVRIAGEGNPGRHGGDVGDLYLNVTVKGHAYFEPQENGDILLELPLTPPEAALGIDVQVPTLSGRVMMKIPAGTQSNQLFRLRGRGLPRIKEKGNADQLVKVRITVPQTLTLEERDLYLQLGRMQRDNPRRSLI
ncbi:MAG: DnaJ domain-containing protein [Candidatus Sericytochromatia bacterium]|nr:DnaJ domain-containing protein [Candidatus Sericytochromatia bacterium]